MPRIPYSISIVLDRSYGLSLLAASLRTGPVWIVESPTNRDSAQRLWEESKAADHPDGITLFKASEGRSPEQMLVDWMDTIDLHHGSYSADPPYTVIRVVGSSLSSQAEQFLSMYGFDSYTPTDDGFRAARPLPPPLPG